MCECAHLFEVGIFFSICFIGSFASVCHARTPQLDSRRRRSWRWGVVVVGFVVVDDVIPAQNFFFLLLASSFSSLRSRLFVLFASSFCFYSTVGIQ